MDSDDDDAYYPEEPHPWSEAPAAHRRPIVVRSPPTQFVDPSKLHEPASPWWPVSRNPTPSIVDARSSITPDPAPSPQVVHIPRGLDLHQPKPQNPHHRPHVLNHVDHPADSSSEEEDRVRILPAPPVVLPSRLTPNRSRFPPGQRPLPTMPATWGPTRQRRGSTHADSDEQHAQASIVPEDIDEEVAKQRRNFESRLMALMNQRVSAKEGALAESQRNADGTYDTTAEDNLLSHLATARSAYLRFLREERIQATDEYKSAYEAYKRARKRVNMERHRSKRRGGPAVTK